MYQSILPETREVCFCLLLKENRSVKAQRAMLRLWMFMQRNSCICWNKPQRKVKRYPRKKVGDIYLDIRVTQCIPCKFPSPQAVQKLPPSALKVDANSSMLRAFFIHAQIFRLLLKISVEKAISRASHYFFLVSPFRWDNRQNVKLYKSLVKRRRQARAQRKSMQRYLMWRGINTNQWVFQINKSEWRPTSFSTTNENPWQ